MDIIKALTKEEVRHFKLFLKRTNTKVSDAPVSKLFDYIRKNGGNDDKAIHKTNFKNLKDNAFYRLKNRMLVDVNKSLLVLNYKRNDSTLIYNYLILSEIFLYKSEYAITYNFLCKAEKKAVEYEYLNLLEMIYDKMIALSHHYVDLPLLEILGKQKEIIEKKKEIQPIKHMMAEILWYLRQSNFGSKGLNIIDELESIKKKLDNIELLKQSSSVRIQMQESIKMMLFQKGDFNSLLIYLRKTLNEFEEDKVFNKGNHNQKIVMLTWLINLSIKLLNFHLAYQYSEELKKSLHQYNNLYYETHIWTYYQCIFGACYYSNQLHRCLKILKTYANEEVLKDHSLYHTYFYINSAIVYYSLKDIKNANKYLNKLLEPVFFDALSDEMKLTVKIVELLFYFENKDYDYFNYSLKKIKKKYKKIFDLPQFDHQLNFLNVLAILGKDVMLENLKTEHIVNDFIANSPPFEVGKNEAIHYKSWLIALVQSKNYYKTLLANLKK